MLRVKCVDMEIAWAQCTCISQRRMLELPVYVYARTANMSELLLDLPNSLYTLYKCLMRHSVSLRVASVGTVCAKPLCIKAHKYSGPHASILCLWSQGEVNCWSQKRDTCQQGQQLPAHVTRTSGQGGSCLLP